MIYVSDSSRVWHVAKTGNDSNSGHAGQYPVNLANDSKLTIGAAINAAASGDTIIIWPGDYVENIDSSEKVLTIIGTSRGVSKIVPETGTALTVGSNTCIRNLTLQALQPAQSVWGLRIGKGSSAPASNVTVEDCTMNGSWDGFAASYSSNVLIRNCIVTGMADGAAITNAKGLIIENCVISALGTYGTNIECRTLMASGAVAAIRDTIFNTTRDDISTSTLMGIYSFTSPCCLSLINCIFNVNAGSSFTGVAYGIRIAGSGKIALNNCVFSLNVPNAGNKVDLYAENGSIVVSDCFYNTVIGPITQTDSGWANALTTALFVNGAANKLKIDTAGRVEAASMAGVDSGLLTKAAKMLVNKAVQDKLSGAIRYYDDDGQTVILTHTPSEDGANMTRVAC